MNLEPLKEKNESVEVSMRFAVFFYNEKNRRCVVLFDKKGANFAQ